MSYATPVERVIAILEEAGYRALGLPLVVASVSFDFTAALVGTGHASDLVVVIDTVQESSARTQQRIDSLGRALDVAKSRRSVTAVLVGPRPADSTLDAISRVCRVLPLGTPPGADADRIIREWLAVLLPLQLPEPSEAIADTAVELGKHLPAVQDSHARTIILDETLHSAAAVRKMFQHLVGDALNDDSDQGNDKGIQ